MDAFVPICKNAVLLSLTIFHCVGHSCRFSAVRRSSVSAASVQIAPVDSVDVSSTHACVHDCGHVSLLGGVGNELM